jgi:hypothetical protein
MSVTDGKIQFANANGDTLEISLPNLPYKSVIDLPFDIQRADTGLYYVYDHGSDADKYFCEADFILTPAEVTAFNAFMKNTGTSYGRAQDLILRMNSASGFFPFTPYRGDKGDFPAWLEILQAPQVQDSPYLHFLLKSRIHKAAGSWPTYSNVPTGYADGGVSIGTVTGLRFPTDWFQHKANYEAFNAPSETNISSWVNKGGLADSYEAKGTFVFDTGKLNALIKYIAEVSRSSSLTLATDDNYYAFGMDKGDAGSYIVRMIQSQLVITHTDYNRFEMPLAFSYIQDSPS